METDRTEVEAPQAGRTVSVGFERGRLVLVWAAIGVLLFVIGTALQNTQSIYAGLILAPLALLGGGILMKEESAVVRFGMLLAAGLILTYVTGMAFQFTLMLT
jgi:uncharacterized membrane protein